jgi:hypothetical protein
MSDHLFGIDGVVDQLLPLGDSIIGAAVTLVTAGITYAVGRARTKAEVDNLMAEKKAIEAATGVSTAEAAQVISEAAAATVQPLLDRIRQQREEILYFNERHAYYLNEIEKIRTEKARTDSENALLKRKLILLGEEIPTLPEER